MAIANPHFAVTFAFNAKGQSVVVEQDSEQDLIARAKNVLVCEQGFREELPEYGVPSLLFRTVPLPLDAVQADVSRWAEIDVSLIESTPSLELATRQILAQVGL